MMCSTFAAACFLILSTSQAEPVFTPPAALRWPEFRGPSGDGKVPSVKDGLPSLPLTWSETENVRWSAEIPGRGWSSPVVWDDQIWLTNSTEDGRSLSVLCFDRTTGKKIFDKVLFEVAHPSEIEKFNSYASPTPAIEAGRIYVSYGMYGLACLDTKTCEILWQRRDLKCEHYRGAGSSPVIIDDLLIEHYDGIDQQFVVALNKETGETIWLTRRPHNFGTGNYDQKKAYATPIAITVNGVRQLISPTSKGLFAYDLATGQELWRTRYEQFSTPCRPLFENGHLYINTGFGKGVFICLKPGQSGDVTDTHTVWSHNRQMPSKPQPIYHDGLIFVVDDAGIVSCMDAADGNIVWQKRIGGNFSASPILSGNRLYLFDEGGKGTVIAPERAYRELASNELPDGCLASPAVAGQSLIVRTRTHLYCLEEAARPAAALAFSPEAKAAAEAAAQAPPRVDAIDAAMKPFIDKGELPGMVTLVANKGKVVHLSSLGLADAATNRPMQNDAMFWIASMTKPMAAAALMILEQEGKLSIEDPVSKYIPEFAELKHRDGTPVKETLRIRHLLTHTSGLGGFALPKGPEIRTLQEQSLLMAQTPVSFEPGSKWAYGWSLQVAGRIVEIISGQSFEEFITERVFKPLHMKDATFVLNEEQAARLVTNVKRNADKTGLEPAPNTFVSTAPGVKQVAMPSGGLFATVEDVRRFYQMLLNGGELDGVRILKPETVRKMTSKQTGDLVTGFTPGNAWGLGLGLVMEPQGTTADLSPGSFGHGGAYGTQAWCDPVKGSLYILMVQRSDIGNSDDSVYRKTLQHEGVKVLSAGEGNRSAN